MAGVLNLLHLGAKHDTLQNIKWCNKIQIYLCQNTHKYTLKYCTFMCCCNKDLILLGLCKVTTHNKHCMLFFKQNSINLCIVWIILGLSQTFKKGRPLHVTVNFGSSLNVVSVLNIGIQMRDKHNHLSIQKIELYFKTFIYKNMVKGITLPFISLIQAAFA